MKFNLQILNIPCKLKLRESAGYTGNKFFHYKLLIFLIFPINFRLYKIRIGNKYYPHPHRNDGSSLYSDYQINVYANLPLYRLMKF